MGPLDRIKNKSIPSSQRGTKGPVWKGPEVDGITQSLLGRFLVCRERFRLLVIEGLKSSEGWNHRMGYGDMWHVCEEAASAEVRHFKGELSGTDTMLWEDNLNEHTEELLLKHPLERSKIEHWYSVCKTQFPIYVRYWRKHPDNVQRTPLFQEKEFKVPYRLPSGRTVILRGKWDAVDLIKEGKTSGVWLQENKTKGDVDQRALAKQLRFDLQTMFYLVALKEFQTSKGQYRLGGEGIPRGADIKGVRYNVVRRPLSGGKGSIVQHKATKTKRAETSEEFYNRLGDVIREDPENFFFRWRAEVTPKDVQTFRTQCLDPVLEQLCDWWEYVKDVRLTDGGDLYHPNETGVRSERPRGLHFRFPYGVYNPMTEGTASDYDEYMDTGSSAGLRRTDDLFPELKEK